MKIVIIGGTGLVGAKLVDLLRTRDHEVIAASPSNGVNSVTGEGIETALQGAEVVVDVTNAPSFADDDVLSFFTTSTRNLLDAESAAGVRHHVLLSIVGADRMPDSGYMRAKVAQENLIKTAKVSFTILRATQFFEFLSGIADANTSEKVIRLPQALIQPIAVDEVTAKLAAIADSQPTNDVVELAGPEAFPMHEIIGERLQKMNDTRAVACDSNALYFGTKLKEESLVPQQQCETGNQRFRDWISLQH